ncbi:MAG: family 43 glycosylhydrolase [Bacteroidales bacterium]|nr:family 43 glycosylhydrolase [Bacteroidales bacterium]
MKKSLLSFCFITLFAVNQLFAQNPIIRDQFTADPSARVFNGKVYLFPSHDIRAKEGMGRPGWFCMADYHVFSSDNLTDWTDHGVIVSQNKVPWVDSTSYSMWAPDCIFRNGKYYFYFPANGTKEVNGRRRFGIGVAIADKPEGPYVPEPEPIKNLPGIDPNIFIDKDGQAYIYWSMGNIFVAKLKDNMVELDSEPQVIKELPQKGLKEGPWLFERNGIYYMTYPHVENTIERLEYAIGDNPLGPFKFAGVIMDESPMNCWTNHHSFIEYNGQWYLFYHQNAYSPKFDKNRSACIDSLFFNADGTIRKVIPTHRGVGLTSASKKIEIDRYSAISEKGATVEFIDTSYRFNGWKTVFDNKDAWIQYNAVDFGMKKVKTIQVNACSESGGSVQIRLNSANGPILSEVVIPKNSQWNIVTAKVKKALPGVHNLVVVSASDQPVEIDWVSFE